MNKLNLAKHCQFKLTKFECKLYVDMLKEFYKTGGDYDNLGYYIIKNGKKLKEVL